MEWECCLKSPEQGAREGAPFIQKHIIESTGKTFDDFAGSETDKEQLKKIGLDENYKIQIVNSTDKEKREKYVKHLYKKLQRDGQLERDVDRLVRNDRIAWGSSMIACKDADAMVTGNIRHSQHLLKN